METDMIAGDDNGVRNMTGGACECVDALGARGEARGRFIIDGRVLHY